MILPPWPYSAAPLAFVGLAALVLWRRMTRLYAALQGAFRDSLSRKDASHHAGAAMLVDVLASGSAQLFQISAGHWAAGRTLLGTELRALTGASVVRIQRGGHALSSPVPGTVLAAGDELLLVGDAEQLGRAVQLLSAGPEGLAG
jgi:hypothetical protein